MHGHGRLTKRTLAELLLIFPGGLSADDIEKNFGADADRVEVLCDELVADGRVARESSVCFACASPQEVLRRGGGRARDDRALTD